MTIPQSSHVTALALSRIRPGYNPRRYFDAKKHDELVASLRLRGMLQPVLLRPLADAEGCYVIVAGGRRYRAALEAFGPDGEVPVVIRDMTDQEALEAAIDENDVRDDASETEQADAALRVLAACGNDRPEAARRLGWSRSKLDRRLALAELSEVVKLALDERRIKVGHAELLAAVPADKQDKALETILTAGLDVGKTRDLLMRVTQSLAHAGFDRTECITCPFNSATQRALFETHVDDGHCTNPGCFQLKTDAAETIRLEEEECTDACDDTLPGSEDIDDEDEDDAIVETTAGPVSRGRSAGHAAASRQAAAPPSAAVKSSGAVTTPRKHDVTIAAIAARTTDCREATWRTALARMLAGNVEQARITILVAAMSGTLSQIQAETLTSRASLLIDASFPDLDYSAKIAAIRTLPDTRTSNVLCVIGAAYAKDALAFGHVADLARAFEVDLRDVWQVDQAFLERYTRDELKFIAQECGLVAHMGEKTFAKLLTAKKADLIAGMLKANGFDWAGRLPSCMTLDARYVPPPIGHGSQAQLRNPALAA